ncbi:MAG: CRISPR-associated endonuclease Cas1 [Candidatus Bathyarchaeota archaeon]|nr:CRISPR-associated endonuclease Cas1 [Candidatus Bathyarchaeota archaeon]
MRIFLDDFGIFLGRKRNRFTIKKKGEVKEIVANDVDSIICCSSGVAFSASALALAVQNNIQVVFARYSGWPYAVLMSASMTGSVRARREQFTAYNDERGFTLAKRFVSGKLTNQANLLKLMAKNRRQSDPKLSENLYEAGKVIDQINMKVEKEHGLRIDDKRQDLMNLEAEAARSYWEAIRQILPAELGFTGRETKGARDPFNAMLNFGYQTILFPEVWKAVSYAGLDFYAGYLHADRPGKPSLVLDLMEEFRQQVVDRTLIGLITKNIIKPDEIVVAKVAEESRVLSKDVVKTLLESLQERLDTEVMFDGQKSSIKGFIHHQARRVARFLLREADYTPFTLGW